MLRLTSPRLRFLRDPGTWPELGTDALWLATTRRPPSLSPTWPLTREALATVRVRWPQQYENPLAASMFDFVLRRFRQHVPVDLTEIPQNEPGLTTFELLIGRERHLVAIDYYDFLHINEGVARSSSLYFKMQHREEGYGRDNVVPGGYVAKRQLLYRFLPRLRQARDRRQFLHDTYGRFSLTFQPELRGRIAELLSSQSDFGYQGGTKVVMYTRHLRDIARSRVCIDVPGQGPLCHRLVDYLAIGACVVGIRPKVVLPVPLEQGHHVLWVRNDLSDLVEICRHKIESPTAIEELAQNARDYFDRYLHQDQLADFYLHSCLQRLV
jgi:Glycosyl transferases group 1